MSWLTGIIFSSVLCFGLPNGKKSHAKVHGRNGRLHIRHSHQKCEGNHNCRQWEHHNLGSEDDIFLEEGDVVEHHAEADGPQDAAEEDQTGADAAERVGVTEGAEDGLVADLLSADVRHRATDDEGQHEVPPVGEHRLDRGHVLPTDSLLPGLKSRTPRRPFISPFPAIILFHYKFFKQLFKSSLEIGIG